MAAKKRTQDVLTDDSWSFSSLLLSENILDGLNEVGFIRPSPVQLKSIPLGICGLDMIVQAKSGTGKTCVFAVVALEMVSTVSFEPQVIVLAPTREIAVQIHDFFCVIGSCTHNLHCNAFIGGTVVEEDKKKLAKCQIVIGTPGRVKSLISSGLLQTHAIRLFVLDEADKLLEPGSFQDQINWIYSTLPKNKQVLALSATYPEYLAEHLINYMNEPAHIRLNTDELTLLGIKQLYITVKSHHLPHVVFEQKAKKLAKFLRRYPFQQCMVFSNYQSRAQVLADMLSRIGWPASCIAGSQSQIERFEAMKQLKDFKCRILISTDLTSRGIDCDKVDLVVNLDMPWDTETYLHRVGRAGRFGNYGLAVSFVAKGKEEEKLRNIAREIKYTIDEISDIGNVGNIADALCNSRLGQQDSADSGDVLLHDEQVLTIAEEDSSVIQQSKKSNVSNVQQNLLDSIQNGICDISMNCKKLSLNESGENDILGSSEVASNGMTLSGDFQDSLKLIHGVDTSNGCLDSLENDREINGQNEQYLTSLKQSFELVEAEVLNSLDNEKVNCGFIMSGPRSMEKCSDAEVNSNANIVLDANVCESTPSELSDFDGSVDSKFEESTDGEVKENRQNYDKLDERGMVAKEITTIELESMLGDLVCDQLIESGARMLRHYYLSEGVLNCSETPRNDEDLNPYEARMEKEKRYNIDIVLASCKNDLTEPKTRLPSTDRNLDESQDILCEKMGLAKPNELVHDTTSDLQKPESNLCGTSDELLQSTDELNGSHTISSEPENISLKSKRDLFESRESLQTSAHGIDEQKVFLNKVNSKPIIKESKLGLEHILEVNIETDRATRTDIDDGSSIGVRNLRDERGGKLYERPDHKLRAIGKNYCQCMRSGKISSSDLRKLSTQTAKYRKPINERNLDSHFGCARPLNARKGINPIVDHEVMTNDRQSRLYATWYDIYRQQLAWIKYHSWQYQKSTAYINEMYYNYWL